MSKDPIIPLFNACHLIEDAEEALVDSDQGFICGCMSQEDIEQCLEALLLWKRSLLKSFDETTCSSCSGSGLKPSDILCPSCYGSGKIAKERRNVWSILEGREDKLDEYDWKTDEFYFIDWEEDCIRSGLICGGCATTGYIQMDPSDEEGHRIGHPTNEWDLSTDYRLPYIGWGSIEPKTKLGYAILEARMIDIKESYGNN